MESSTSTQAAPRGLGRLRGHFDDQLYRTGYYLIIGTGITSLLGVAFWALAARSYSAHQVGQNAAAISAMTLVSGVCSLGLSAVLVRYLPIAGTATKRLVSGSYGLTIGLSLVFGAVVAATSEIWSPALSFLREPAWLAGFTLATAATTVFTLEDSVLTGLRAARWIPLENSLYALAKLVLLIVLAGVLPTSGPFVSWNAPLLPAIVLVNYLIFRRLIPADRSFGSLDRRKVIRMAAGNYGGNLFALVGNMYLPILVANRISASQAAYFFVPWMISLSLQLVALNVTTSLTVEAALDMPRLRELCRRALAHSMRLVAPLAALVALAAPVALLVFGQAYADSGSGLLRLLALGAIPNVIVALGIGVARIEHKGQVVVAIQAAQFAIVLGLSALLLPSMGIEAVGLTWAGSQFLLAAVLLATTLRPLVLPERFGAARGSGPG
ncbi:MAG: lipopolysaccharide biosynthesis protein [Solirubrobacterales bacterium]